MSRAAGWYWVKHEGEWSTAYYGALSWTWMYMREDGFDEMKLHEDKDVPFSEIGPRIPTPDEPWQCVPVEPTQKMVQAGNWSGSGDVSVNESWARRVVWERMLAAAPKPDGGK